MGKIITSMRRLVLLASLAALLPTATALSTPSTPTTPPPVVTTRTPTTPTTTPLSITRTPPPPAKQLLSANQQGLEADAGKFPRTWVPLASIYELDPDRPTPLEFLGQRYVTFRDNNNEWVVLDDVCPHRLAPLSEGRVDRSTNTIECSYHGWAFDGKTGACDRIPQAEASVVATAQKSAKSSAQSYSVVIEKNVLWTWPWAADCLSVMGTAEKHPAHMVAGVGVNSTTYTRDLPYGWDTLLENLVDPSHVPFAHHGLQGSRQDAVPINMTSPVNLNEHGFDFTFADQTGGRRRAGGGCFRAPFTIQYNATFEQTEAQQAAGEDLKFFNLTALCIPTKPGWSRTIVFGAPPPKSKKEKAQEEAKNVARAKGKDERETAGAVSEKANASASVQSNSKPKKLPLKLQILFKVIRILPVWLLHQLSNKFLDSDLAFLHFQEQERAKQGVDLDGYFMPAQADRCVVAQRQWVNKYAHVPGPLPPAISDKSVLFDRWAQHTDHCKHCSQGYKSIQKWRTYTYLSMGVSIILIKFLAARFAAVGCLAMLRLLSMLEEPLKVGGFKHYENH